MEQKFKVNISFPLFVRKKFEGNIGGEPEFVGNIGIKSDEGGTIKPFAEKPPGKAIVWIIIRPDGSMEVRPIEE